MRRGPSIASDDDRDVSSSSDGSDNETDQLVKAMASRRDQRQGERASIRSALSEVPILFTERTYERELVLMIVSVVVTLCITGDQLFGAVYVISSPFDVSTGTYGALIMLQGVTKFAAFAAFTCIVRVVRIPHTLIMGIALLNYVAYYVGLGVASELMHLYVVSATNLFGAFAVPILHSYFKLNVGKMKESVILLIFLASYLGNMIGTGVGCGVELKFHSVFPGAVYLVWVGMILLLTCVALATYCTTSVLSDRKKYNRLLHDRS